MLLFKNQLISLRIIGMTAEGSGVGRTAPDKEHTQGLAIFVPFTAPGDEIECRIVKVMNNRAYGKMEKLIKPSPDRIPCSDRDPSFCSVFGKCGGCVYRHVRYEAELQYKWQRVEDALHRIGGLETEIRPIIPCDQTADAPDRYRNKAQYPFAPGPYRPLAGFYAPRSHRVVEQHHCPLQPAVFGVIVDSVVKWAKNTGLPIYDESTGKGILRHLYLRQAQVTGEIMVCLVCTSGKLPRSRELIQRLQEEVPGLASVIVNLNPDRTNVVLGRDSYVLWGQETITDQLCGLRFRLSPRSFYQVNHAQAERLYALAAQEAALTGKETLLDLYCGTGTIGLSMAKQAKNLIGVETVMEAVEDARKNAEDNGIDNARFLCADAVQAALQLREQGIHPQVVILDPPRKGCEEALIGTLTGMGPDRIVYISCDPATLARDLSRFQERSYRTVRLTPVDMFPRTSHVECVALLTKV